MAGHVLILNDPAVDRSMWWPVAAQLADAHTVVVLDLPEHNSPQTLTEELGLFVQGLGTRAPVLVGHAAAALVASLFAAGFSTHAIVNVGQTLDLRPPASATGPEAAYDAVGCWQWWEGVSVRDLQREIIANAPAIRSPYLSVFGVAPRPGYADWLRRRIPRSRCKVYGTAGRFLHLADLPRFVADVRSVTR